MRPGLRIFTGALACVIVCWSPPAKGYDQQVSSSLWAEGYSVLARDGSPIRRRRIVEDLHLSAWNLIPGSSDPYYRGVRLSLNVHLRLDSDFAIQRHESRPGVKDGYVPGLTPLAIDALVVQLHIRDLLDGVLDVRLGRQIRIDTLGYFAFDGLATSFDLPAGIGIDTYIGYEVRGGDQLGYDALELDGTDSGDRHNMEADRYPDREEPRARLAVGMELSFSPRRWVDAAVSYRTVGLSMPLADQLLGGRLHLGSDPVWFDARAVWSPLIDKFTQIDAELATEPGEVVTISLDYHLYRPLFEGDSIFNVFALSPENDLGTRIELRLNESMALAGWGFVRLADETGGMTGDRQEALLLGAGGGVGGNYYSHARTLAVRFSGIEEWGEDRLGVEIGVGQGLLPLQRLWLNLRLSYWHVDDAESKRFSGNMVGYVLSARFRLAVGAEVLGEFEHYVDGDGEQRFYALALLKLDLWR